MICPIVKLTQDLIRIPSISPQDLGCQDILIQRLLAIGFIVKTINIADTKNFWAYRGEGTTLTFAGHTDVVPPGDNTKWHTDPFNPIIDNGILFGRGASDMKGALSAMIVAAERFVIKCPNYSGRLSFLITSDEESSAVHGTKKVVDYLISKSEKIDYCIVGEPSSTSIIGDVIKNGRRGSITADLTIHGIQGHIAYPELADNPIHKGLPIILEILSIKLDNGNDYFPPTSINIPTIHAGEDSSNVIPESLCVKFNLRFSTELSVREIKLAFHSILDKKNIKYSIKWSLSGYPFITKKGILINKVTKCILKFNQNKPMLSTSGGTSDGRFISIMGSEIIELGLTNSTIHKINECVKISDLKILSLMYQNIMQRLLV
ncbi:succinyl-diaminopimelate desuccinylase [Buchnera aphidicola]|uniref:succinyl-diaminopimelate desuccinylase n=1 Tax=Buchnera aphidicola TaxID=9 RepID=UPI0034641D45